MQILPWRLGAVDDVSVMGPEVDTNGWLAARVQPPPPDIVDALASQALQTRSPGPGSKPLFDAVAALIAAEPDLLAVVATRVRTVHLLMAAPGYDVSHSEPRWPALIFVSQPERADVVGTLRLAESIVHEAMHLHLTVHEKRTKMVADPNGTMHSPWRNAPRPYGGVLHGLFVFTCIHAFFRRLAPSLDGAALAHVERRLVEIRAEIEAVALDSLIEGLTLAGAACAHQWSSSLSKQA